MYENINFIKLSVRGRKASEWKQRACLSLSYLVPDSRALFLHTDTTYSSETCQRSPFKTIQEQGPALSLKHQDDFTHLPFRLSF